MLLTSPCRVQPPIYPYIHSMLSVLLPLTYTMAAVSDTTPAVVPGVGAPLTINDMKRGHQMSG